MKRDATARRSVLADHEQPCHTIGSPAALGRETPRQPRLPIKRDEHELDVRQRRLDLDDQHDTRPLVKGKHVDRATLAIHVERHLCGDPPPSRAKDSNNLLHDRRVIRVEEAIERLAVPSQATEYTRSKRRSHPVQRRHGDPVRVTLLDPRDDAPGQSGALRQVVLSPAPAPSQCPYASAEPDPVHGPIMTTDARLAID